jgi:TfoX/Sxy family transcriptional regulator of competence genes
MPFDEQLAARVRSILAGQRGVTEKTLMGTLAFMIDGAMCCSVGRNGLLVRVAVEQREELLGEPYVSPMKLGARTMKGFVRVAPQGLPTRAKLAKWIARGLAASAGSRRKPSKPRRVAAPRRGD